MQARAASWEARGIPAACHDLDSVYTSAMDSSRAKLFPNGGSQAVRLPKSCRFPDGQGEVLVHREGRKVILEPLDEWSAKFLGCLGAWDQEIARPQQSLTSKLKDPFA